MTASDTHRAIDAVWRIESPRLIAGLARIVRDVGLAEDFAQDALVAALEQWPESGVPNNPGAWLMATRTVPSCCPHIPTCAHERPLVRRVGWDRRSRANRTAPCSKTSSRTVSDSG